MVSKYPLKHKFNAVKTVRDGLTFHSKKEARYYDHLKALKKSGDLLFFLRQVPFDLPGKIKYRCDFVLFWASGYVQFVDVKGHRTKQYIDKKKQVEAIYPITIEER